MAATNEKDPHLLSVKVLRASRPGIAFSHDAFVEPTSDVGRALTELSLNDAVTSWHPKASGTAESGIEPFLTLPAAFGTVHLGESFSGLVVVNSEAPFSVHDARLRVEMQTASAAKFLLAEVFASEPLKSQGTLQTMVTHELKEIGLHALVCTVSYVATLDSNGETRQRSFRKVYKFQVCITPWNAWSSFLC
jgi:trafficking protein particle complex subunit 13